MRITSSYNYIPVTNLQAAAKWYKEHLGFNIVMEDPIFLELRTESGFRIFLIPNNDENIHSHMNYSNGPQASFGFTVSDLEVVYQQFKDKGIKVGKISNYAGLSFGFEDPDGNRIEIWSDY
ncbi:VOC family protein [Heyndrickxia sp. NPDC080065]|uniref:VOC family protein n=1 Tax=Heyndrickxia sp. NPDC080065 TaxID=3390568 RepID=UPI003D068B77